MPAPPQSPQTSAHYPLPSPSPVHTRCSNKLPQLRNLVQQLLQILIILLPLNAGNEHLGLLSRIAAKRPQLTLLEGDEIGLQGQDALDSLHALALLEAGKDLEVLLGFCDYPVINPPPTTPSVS